MRSMMITFVCLAGCGLISEDRPSPVAESVVFSPEDNGDVPVRPQLRPDELAVSPEPSAPEVSTGTLGRTVASLGNAAEPGMWLKTPLVSTTQPGQVFFPKTGKTVNVTLIPIEGTATAGSRISLAAMQGVGASLTDLIEVDVLAE